MGMLRPVWSLTTIATLSLTAPALASPPEVKPRADYQGVVIGSDPENPELAFYSGVHQVNGKLAICGLIIITTKDNSLARGERQIARQLSYRLGGEDLFVQSDSFKRYKSEAEAFAGTAGCSVFKRRPWQPAYATLPYEMSGGRVTYTDQ